MVVEATIEIGADPNCRIVCFVPADTGAAYLTQPDARRSHLSQLTDYDTSHVETASQTVVTGDIRSPILLRFVFFRQVLTEVLSIDIEPADGVAAPSFGEGPPPASPARAVERYTGPRRIVTEIVPERTRRRRTGTER